MAKYQPIKGPFTPKNPHKYFGGPVDKITYRSSWELTCMMEFDNNPSVIGWASETCAIPYYNPFTKRQTVYIPDFVVVYDGIGGKRRAVMLEIKPAKEVPGYLTEKGQRLSAKDKAAQALNLIKWQAAQAFCSKRGIEFKILTEYEIYSTMKKSKKK